MTESLTIENITLKYEKFTAVQNFSLHVEDGEFVCLLGSSGCGKTSVLRAIAGFEKIQAGVIKVGSKEFSTANSFVAPEKRNVGMMFQDFALFPHLSVWENVIFGLRHLTKDEKEKRANKLLKLLDLENLKNSYPHKLSGGQQQRVSLARTLAPQPSIILMDEPFSSLDYDLSIRLSREIKSVIKALGITVIMVTHNHEEAFRMADKICVMKEGAVLQFDSPLNLYQNPINQDVASFFGSSFFLNGKLLNADVVETRFGKHIVQKNLGVGDAVQVLFRPNQFLLSSGSNGLKARISKKEILGESFYYYVDLEGEEIQVSTSLEHSFDLDDEVMIEFKEKSVVCF